MTNFTMQPGEMPAAQRSELARSLPQYLTRDEASSLAGVHPRTIDRWRRLWEKTEGRDGLKTYFKRVAIDEHPPGDVRVSKVQLLERIGFTEDVSAVRPAPRTIAQASRAMFGEE